MESYRLQARSNNPPLTKSEREKLLAPHLPAHPRKLADSHTKGGNFRKHTQKGFEARRFLSAQLHVMCYLIVHAIFSIYIRFRRVYKSVTDRTVSVLYYHHRAPELIQKDVKGLCRLPNHLSVILNLTDGGRGAVELEDLIEKVAELSAWSACVGIPTLSIYEKTGILKRYISVTQTAITKKLSLYLGAQQPALSVRAPHIPPMESPATSPDACVSKSPLKHLSVLLLSIEDGRDSLVDLTKTLAEMVQCSKLSPEDISVDLIDTEISESAMSDPDLLILFTPSVELSGYPPWQIRLTEIFHVQDNHAFCYQVFLRALYSYANAEMRYGR